MSPVVMRVVVTVPETPRPPHLLSALPRPWTHLGLGMACLWCSDPSVNPFPCWGHSPATHGIPVTHLCCWGQQLGCGGSHCQLPFRRPPRSERDAVTCKFLGPGFLCSAGRPSPRWPCAQTRWDPTPSPGPQNGVETQLRLPPARRGAHTPSRSPRR